MRSLLTNRTWLAAVAALFYLTPAAAVAQQDDSRQQAGAASTSLTLPAAQGLIELKANTPQEVRAGESFTYEVNISNISDNVMLHDVKIKQMNQEGLSIRNATMQDDQKTGNSAKQGNRGGSAEKAGDEANKQDSEPADGNLRSQDRSQQDRPAAEGDQSNQGNEAANPAASANETAGSRQNPQPSDGSAGWTIDTLKPGETRTIQVTATARQEGEAKACLAVTSYSSALCLNIKAVKPELELVKTAPQQMDWCQPLEWEYFVKNSGTGDLGTFTVNDELPQGIETVEGRDSLEFKVDGLKAGEVRKFIANLNATEAGTFESIATAEYAQGRTAQSDKAGTKVTMAKLDVAIDGPKAVYVDRLMNYTIRITNNGESTANNASFTLRYPGELDIADMGEPSSSRQSVSGSNEFASSSEDELTAASDRNRREGPPGSNRRSDDKQQLAADEEQTWEIGALQAGETIAIDLSMRSRAQGTAMFEVTSDYVCGPDDKGKQQTAATASTRTKIIALPALAIAVVDQTDPVALNEELQYVIVVGNEGQAPDQDVKLSVKLPEQLKYVDGSGETTVESRGNELSFAPVDKLEPGEKVRWNITTKAQSKGDVQLRVEMTSKHHSRPTVAEEPTTLFDGGQQQGGQQQGRQDSGPDEQRRNDKDAPTEANSNR
ncbi:MAG: hypothetical protein WEA31_01900 [Pirellulales bacterium]